jgi:hypothetical protein
VTNAWVVGISSCWGVPCGGDGDEGIARAALSTHKPEVVVKQDTLQSFQSTCLLMVTLSAMRTRTAKALEQSRHAHRYQKTSSRLEFLRASL